MIEYTKVFANHYYTIKEKKTEKYNTVMTTNTPFHFSSSDYDDDNDEDEEQEEGELFDETFHSHHNQHPRRQQQQKFRVSIKKDNNSSSSFLAASNEFQSSLLVLHDRVKQKFPSETSFNYYKKLLYKFMRATSENNQYHNSTSMEEVERCHLQLQNFISSLFVVTRQDYQDQNSFAFLDMRLKQLLRSHGNSIQYYDSSDNDDENDDGDIDDSIFVRTLLLFYSTNQHQSHVNSNDKNENDIDDVPDEMYQPVSSNTDDDENNNQHATRQQRRQREDVSDDDDDDLDDDVKNENSTTTSSSCSFDGRPLAQWLIELLAANGVHHIARTDNRQFVLKEITMRMLERESGKSKNDDDDDVAVVDSRDGWVRIEQILMFYAQNVIRDVCLIKRNEKDGGEQIVQKE